MSYRKDNGDRNFLQGIQLGLCSFPFTTVRKLVVDPLFSPERRALIDAAQAVIPEVLMFSNRAIPKHLALSFCLTNILAIWLEMVREQVQPTMKCKK